MKNRLLLPATFLFLLLAATSISLIPARSYAQDKQDKKAQQQALIRNLVDSQNYVFVAQSATSLGGRTRQLTPDYDLKVSKTTVISSLPYYGRAYTAPMDPSQNGLNFTTKDFVYTAAEGKKGGWDISIKPRDNRDIQQVSLSVSADGYTTLQVISNSRQMMSFYGYIRAPKLKK